MNGQPNGMAGYIGNETLHTDLKPVQCKYNIFCIKTDTQTKDFIFRSIKFVNIKTDTISTIFVK